MAKYGVTCKVCGVRFGTDFKQLKNMHLCYNCASKKHADIDALLV